jgi:hypothetical protein
LLLQIFSGVRRRRAAIGTGAKWVSGPSALTTAAGRMPRPREVASNRSVSSSSGVLEDSRSVHADSLAPLARDGFDSTRTDSAVGELRRAPGAPIKASPRDRGHFVVGLSRKGLPAVVVSPSRRNAITISLFLRVMLLVGVW